MLEVNQVSKSYGKVLANDQISFVVPDRSVSLLVGPNGAGKSTLLKCITGLLRYEGTITVDDFNNKSTQARQRLGYVPEIPHLYPLLTINEHLEFVARAYKLPDGWQQRAEQLLERLDLSDKKSKLGASLSKGMQQKLSVCAALLPQPNFILFDEPLIGLDPHAIKEMKLIFQELAEQGHSLLISTHILDTVDELWDQVLILKDGKLVASGQRSELVNLGVSLEKFYFDVTESEAADTDSVRLSLTGLPEQEQPQGDEQTSDKTLADRSGSRRE